MIYTRSVIHCADNTGALMLRCIGLLKGAKFASLGDEIVVSVISVNKKLPASNIKVTKGSIHRALLVRTRKPFSRADGMTFMFDDNAAVILNKQGEPLGSRVSGLIAKELRQYQKLWSIAKEVIS